MNPRNSSRSRPALTLGLLALTVALAMGVSGCGSGSSSSSGAASAAPAPADTPTSTPTHAKPSQSIEEYGSAAGRSEGAEVSAAAHSFFTALADADYDKVCAGLLAADRSQLQGLKLRDGPGGCAPALKTLFHRGVATEARSAAAGTVAGVRVEGDTAFFLFTPEGGEPSYFVMKREGGSWKATSPTPGSPLEISIPQGH